MKKIILTVCLLLLYTPYTHAELAGKKTIFVHGFQDFVLFKSRFGGKPDIEAIREHARGQRGQLMKNNHFDDYIFYDSNKRVDGNHTFIREQIKRIEREKTCTGGCIFVTYSTGDIVTRFIMDRLSMWGVNPSDFRILLTFDFAGAGGGTELADTVVGIAHGNLVSSAVVFALESFLGLNIQSEPFLGILHDLRPSAARNNWSDSPVPRLRIVGGKANPLFYFFKGRNDSVVPLHSACGSRIEQAYRSCDTSIAINGAIMNAQGPQKSDLQTNHYPIMMGKDMIHQNHGYTGMLVGVNNHRQFGPVKTSFREYEQQEGYWFWRKTYRRIQKSDTENLMEYFVRQFDR